MATVLASGLDAEKTRRVQLFIASQKKCRHEETAQQERERSVKLAERKRAQEQTTMNLEETKEKVAKLEGEYEKLKTEKQRLFGQLKAALHEEQESQKRQSMAKNETWSQPHHVIQPIQRSYSISQQHQPHGMQHQQQFKPFAWVRPYNIGEVDQMYTPQASYHRQQQQQHIAAANIQQQSYLQQQIMQQQQQQQHRQMMEHQQPLPNFHQATMSDLHAVNRQYDEAVAGVPTYHTSRNARSPQTRNIPPRSSSGLHSVPFNNPQSRSGH